MFVLFHPSCKQHNHLVNSLPELINVLVQCVSIGYYISNNIFYRILPCISSDGIFIKSNIFALNNTQEMNAYDSFPSTFPLAPSPPPLSHLGILALSDTFFILPISICFSLSHPSKYDTSEGSLKHYKNPVI